MHEEHDGNHLLRYSLFRTLSQCFVKLGKAQDKIVSSASVEEIRASTYSFFYKGKSPQLKDHFFNQN